MDIFLLALVVFAIIAVIGWATKYIAWTILTAIDWIFVKPINWIKGKK